MNSAALERTLRKRMIARTKIVAADVRGAGGYVAYQEGGEDTGPITIAWDPMQYDVLGLVIHELCHPKLDRKMSVLGGQGEAAIEGIAETHAGYIRLSPARYAWWRAEIKKRLCRKSLRAWLAA